MYMPGDDIKKITKASMLELDTAMLDCEDAVAVNRKEVAREVICEGLNMLDFGRTERGVRVNSVSSGLCGDDIKAVLSNTVQPDIIMVPKLDSLSEVTMLNKAIAASTSTPFPIIFQTESAIGLINLNNIILALLASSHVIPVGIVFGADDYVSDVRAGRNIDAVMYARQCVVAHARAYNLQPIDRVHIEFNDLAALESECASGFSWGFSGKQCIHPAQIPVVQRAFSPTDQQLAYSRELIAAFRQNQSQGIGSFNFHGKMIDRPTLLQAENIINMFDDSTQTTT